MKRFTVLLIALIVCAASALAQTHAEATSQKWKGIDVNDVLGHESEYPSTEQNDFSKGFKFVLYNVGTGRFVVQGGDWAMEGRLFYPDFGRTMALYANGHINGGITETQTDNKNSFCVRPPEPYSKSWKNDYDKINLTTLMDGNEINKNGVYYPMVWNFQRVENESNTDTYTYYMWMTCTKSGNTTNYYLGAAWGKCENSDRGKGDFIQWDPGDDDRCVWTTANVIGNTEKKTIFNHDEVEIQKLYQWRLISLDEFITVLTQDEVGINPSISSLIPDRDFTRNSDDFFGDWQVSRLPSYTYAEGTKRYPYTWGDYRKDAGKIAPNNQQSRQYNNKRLVNEAWDLPVKLKAVFDKVTSTNNSDTPAGKKNAKFGFLPFEGAGTIYTDFEVPKPGWYQIECTGFYQGPHPGYMFARVISNNEAINSTGYKEEMLQPVIDGDLPHYGKVTLHEAPEEYSKDNYEHCLEVGKELLYNADNYKQKVWVLVKQEDWDSGKKTIRVGFGKDGATSNGTLINDGYYDTDWMCVDDLRASYMGLAPVFFYEDEESLNYLSHDEDDRENFSKNEYVPATLDGRYAGAACLERTFTIGEWNTFSFPLSLTGEQVRNAFSEKTSNECRLLILNSIGGYSHNDCVIDFKTVNIVTLDPVVVPGNLYLLKPTKNPSFGENPRGEMADYYDLGKMFFSTNAEDSTNPEYEHPVIDLSVVNGQQPVGSYNDTNDGVGHVSYVQTPGYASLTRTSGKYTNRNEIEGLFAPQWSYIMSGGKMYEINKDTRIKGFRGWITLTHSIFQESASAPVMMSIDGVLDGYITPTGISQRPVEITPMSRPNIVYDLSGRRVSDSTDHLPKGLYIVDGKKLMVK